MDRTDKVAALTNDPKEKLAIWGTLALPGYNVREMQSQLLGQGGANVELENQSQSNALVVVPKNQASVPYGQPQFQQQGFFPQSNFNQFQSMGQAQPLYHGQMQSG